MTAEPDGCVQECTTHQQDDQSESGVVVAAKGIGPLQLSYGGVELAGMVRQGLPLGGIETGRVDGVQKGTARQCHPFDGIPGPGGPGRGPERQSPPEDGKSGGNRAQAHQNEEDSPVERDSHVPEIRRSARAGDGDASVSERGIDLLRAC